MLIRYLNIGVTFPCSMQIAMLEGTQLAVETT
jgi:hypothetical protein